MFPKSTKMCLFSIVFSINENSNSTIVILLKTISICKAKKTKNKKRNNSKDLEPHPQTFFPARRFCSPPIFRQRGILGIQAKLLYQGSHCRMLQALGVPLDDWLQKKQQHDLRVDSRRLIAVNNCCSYIYIYFEHWLALNAHFTEDNQWQVFRWRMCALFF